MKKIIGALLSLSIVMSGIIAVKADTNEVLLSTGKPVEAGISGNGDVHDDTHGFVENIVDGSAEVTYNQSKMWHLHSTVDEDTVWLNIDLEDSYVITGIVWTARYEGSTKTDYKDVVVYGANKSDFSDKAELLRTGDGSDFVGQVNRFNVSTDEVKEYRYIRFERKANMGGIEIEVYGYRNSATNARLKSLEVDGFELNTAFSPETVKYNVVSNQIPSELTVTAEAEEDGATVSVIGDDSIVAGINEIRIEVTAPDGLTKKDYIIEFVVSDEIDISSGCVVTAVNNAKSGDEAVFTNLFTSSVKRTEAWIFYTEKGYIDVDLGKEYSLSRIEWTKSDLEAAGVVTIEGSATADYAQTVELAAFPAMDKETTVARASLISNEKYRYLRIKKDYTNAEFLPLQIRVYALPEIEITNSSVKTQIDISSEIAGAVLHNVTKGDTDTSWATNATEGVAATPINLFAGSEKNTYIGYYEGYIEVDLGKEYNLSGFEWTRNGQFGSMRPVSIYASSDEEFTAPVLIGQTQNDVLSCELDSENEYRYLRIEKTKASDWYPNTIRLYALVDDVQQADKTETTINVPCRYYSAGDTIIAAVYSNGVLCGLKTEVVQSGESEKTISVTADKNSSLKLMVWNSFSQMKARAELIEIR